MLTEFGKAKMSKKSKVELMAGEDIQYIKEKENLDADGP